MMILRARTKNPRLRIHEKLPHFYLRFTVYPADFSTSKLEDWLAWS